MTGNEIESRQAILATLARIPLGQVSTYGQVAKLAGQPGKARYVAYILKNLPSDTEIPWHRVINSQGKISFPHASEKYQEQFDRLIEEGIVVPLSKRAQEEFLWLGN